MKRVITNTIAAAAVLFAASTLQAQATRTWVSGVGDDVNPCSRTAPCKTWAGAISKTAAGGEIDALDPGGFGALTITKSITVEGTQGQGFGSTLHSSVNGFVINDALTASPNSIKVTLRNLSINGAGTTLGTNSVRFLSGKELNVENVVMMNISGRGIDIQRANGAPVGLVNVINSTIQNCGAGAIVANATASTGVVKISVVNSRLLQCASGIFAGQNSEYAISNTLISHNTVAGIDASSTGVVNIDNSTIMNNVIGVQTAGSATVRLSRNVIVQNATRGFAVNAGQIQSYLDNYFAGNGPNLGALTNISAQKQ